MKYSLYLDDIRSPELKAPIGDEWVICRNYKDFIATLITYGMPSYISFDHDLGEDEPDGYTIAKRLCQAAQSLGFPEGFEFNVHSANPIGAANIIAYMNNYIKFCNTK